MAARPAFLRWDDASSSEDDDDDAFQQIRERHTRKRESEQSAVEQSAVGQSSAAVQSAHTLHEAIKSCWACHVPLVLTENKYCWYETHEHPHLSRIPVCCLCRDVLLSLKESESEHTTEDTCWGCAQEENLLLLCDTCPGQWCTQCLEGLMPSAVVQEHLSSDGPWKCPSCDPPSALEHLENTFDSTDTSNERTLDQVLQELSIVLEEHETTGQLLERDGQELENIRAKAENEESAQSDWLAWKEQFERHDERLASTLASLHDELEDSFEADLAVVYQRLGAAPPRSDDVVPDHVVRAEEALRKRDSLEQQRPLPPQAFNNTLHDDYEDVEDLDELEESSMIRGRGSGFASNNTYLHVQAPSDDANWQQNRREFLEQVHQVQAHEDAVLADRKIAVAKRPEAHDLEETKQLGETVIVEGKRRIRKTQPPASSTNVLPKHTVTKRRDHAPAEPSIRSPPRLQSSRRHNGLTPPRKLAAVDQSKLAKENVLVGRKKRDPVWDPPKTPSPAAPLCSNSESSDVILDPPRTLSPSASFHSTLESSDLVLSRACDQSNPPVLRTVQVAKGLAKILKSHQREGVEFLWSRTFADLAYSRDGTMVDNMEGYTKGKEMDIGGSLLAHNMGLGKSLTTIATLHTALTHPSLKSSKTQKGFVHTALLVVPVNTLANWEQEFQKWTHGMDPAIVVSNLHDIKDPRTRSKYVERWMDTGGVLILSDRTLPKVVSTIHAEGGRSLQPDVLVMDEMHTMLSKLSNQAALALQSIKTKRRIGLTGSPLQNNLTEYFHILNYLRPGLFGYEGDSRFQAEYGEPIELGMRSDSSPAQQQQSDIASARFVAVAAPFVHRKDARELMKDLPPLQQVVIHTRQSRTQARLYRAFQQLKVANFFSVFSALRPIHNHPSCLLRHQPTDDLAKVTKLNPDWWKKVVTPEKLDNVNKGYKIVLLLHILAYAQKLDEKVVVFSQCLRTLDFVEKVLSSEPGAQSVVEESFPGGNIGKWKRNVDYLRIDGSSSAVDRGTMVIQFNQSRESAGVFLISVKAGGIGINLPAASRVVLLDTHFNPTVTNQAIFRTYRYGQTRPVFVYRLLTEGTLEEKVYSRAVNKTGVALRVIDRQAIKRLFTEKELQDLQSTLEWVQCDKCEKWRMLIGQNNDDLPDEWYCHMNNDVRNNSCSHPERSQIWYEQNPLSTSLLTEDHHVHDETEQAIITDDQLVSNDEILQHILKVTLRGKNAPLVSRHYFHESLMKAKDMSPSKSQQGSTPVKAEALIFEDEQNYSEGVAKSDAVLRTQETSEDMPKSPSKRTVRTTPLRQSKLKFSTPTRSQSLKRKDPGSRASKSWKRAPEEKFAHSPPKKRMKLADDQGSPPKENSANLHLATEVIDLCDDSD